MRLPIVIGLVTLMTYACSAGEQQEASKSSPATSGTRQNPEDKPQHQFGLLPTEKNTLPITPDTLCAGIRAALSTAKQKLDVEANAICDDKTANQNFTDAMAQPYQGEGNPEVIRLRAANPGDGNVANFVVYAIRIKKKPVNAILAEEGIVRQTDYRNANDGFSLALGFDIQAAVNEGDADTAFRVAQNTAADRQVNGRVGFADLSFHDLKLYLMFPNNFDFLMAGRTLVEPTVQIKYAGVLRAAMPDPTDPNYTISISVVNFVMNDRGFPDQIGEAFDTFIVSDIVSTYKYHSQNP